MHMHYTCQHPHKFHHSECPVGAARLRLLRTEHAEVYVGDLRVGRVAPYGLDGEEIIVYSLVGPISRGMNCTTLSTPAAVALSTELDGVFGVRHAQTGQYVGLF